MTSIDLPRALALCVLLASAETLHGIARTVWLAPRIGKQRAVQLSALSGTLLAAALCWAFVPGIGAQGLAGHALLGLGLAAFMAAFDVAIGRWVMRFGWARIAQDFDPRRGNYLSLALVCLMLLPAGVWWVRG